MNLLFLLIEVILSYIILLFVYKKYKEEGIYIWIIVILLISSIMSIKSIEINNVNIALGIGVSSSIYIANNILIQKKGTEHMKKITTIMLIISFIFISLLILSSGLQISDYNNISNLMYNNVIFSNIKFIIANVISIITAIYINNFLYYELRKVKNKIWISNIFSSLIFAFVESIIFVFITKFINGSLYVVMMTIVIRYILRLIILIIGTDVVYIANNFRERL